MDQPPRIQQAEALLASFGWEVEHCRHVRDLAVSLFDQLQPLHQLGPQERDILNAAALLHDIGWTVERTSHHKHSFDLIRQHETNLPGFTDEQVGLIATVARYHRKSPPSPEHKEFARLSAADQHIVERLAALLRIADGLDRPHLQSVRELYCGVTDRHVLVGVKALTEAGVHIEGARRKRELFEAAYGLPIEFSIIEP